MLVFVPNEIYRVVIDYKYTVKYTIDIYNASIQ